MSKVIWNSNGKLYWSYNDLVSSYSPDMYVEFDKPEDALTTLNELRKRLEDEHKD